MIGCEIPHTLLRVLDIIGFRHQDKKSGVLHYSSESSECGDAFDKSCNTPLVYGGSIVSDSSLDDGFRNVVNVGKEVVDDLFGCTLIFVGSHCHAYALVCECLQKFRNAGVWLCGVSAMLVIVLAEIFQKQIGRAHV